LFPKLPKIKHLGVRIQQQTLPKVLEGLRRENKTYKKAFSTEGFFVFDCRAKLSILNCNHPDTENKYNMTN
jgi:hypothetical protein